MYEQHVGRPVYIVPGHDELGRVNEMGIVREPEGDIVKGSLEIGKRGR
jgi:hypothetical protein